MATNDSGSDTAETKRVRIPSKHPSFYAMVTEALTKLDDRKGVSVQAIRAFILETYKTVDPNKLKFRMKIALAKGIESGIFKRPKSSEDQKGAIGRFKIDKTVMEAANKPKKVKKPKPDEEKKTSKSKVAKMNETKEKSILKSTKKTPAKSRAKSPKVKKTAKSKSDSPKMTKPKKKLIDEPAKPKNKAKTTPKKKTPKKKAVPKKKVPAKSND